VPLVVEQGASAAVVRTAGLDPVVLTWWGTTIECVSALSRLEGEGRLDAASVTLGISRLDQIAASWVEVGPSSRVRRAAQRLLRVHPLRAGEPCSSAPPSWPPMATRDRSSS
jgi:hypothetical protein